MRNMTEKSVANLIEKWGEKYGDRVALHIRRYLRTERIKYTDLDRLTKKMGGLLERNGVKKGDRVLIWGLNMPEWTIAFLGCLRFGVILVPVGVNSTVDLVKKYIDQTEPKMMFVSRFMADFEKISIDKIVMEDLIDLLDDCQFGRVNKVSGDDLAEIVFTSGTTGDPKGVMISHQNLLFGVGALLDLIPKYKHFRLLSVLPLSHIMEQVAGVVAPLERGATLFYLPRINTLTLKKAIKKYRITTINLVPQVMRMFMDSIEHQAKIEGKEKIFATMLGLAQHLPMNLRRKIFAKVHRELGGKLYMFGVGSAPLDVGLAKKWEALGVKVVEGYGATETTAMVTLNSVYDRELGSVGKPIPGVSLKISDNNEILIKSDGVTPGYYKNEKKTREVFDSDGYYKTGDMGKFGKKGCVYITGRDKFKIVTAAGDKVFPEDVERVLNAHPDVWDSCVFGIKKGDGEVVTATLILKNKKASVKNVIEDANKKLEVAQRILDFKTWEEKDFPRLHTLKVNRAKVIAKFDGSDAGTTEEKVEIKDKVVELLALVCKADRQKIRESSRLVSDLQLDSLRRVALVALIEQDMGISVDENLIDTKTNVSDLREMIKKSNNKLGEYKYSGWSLHPIISKLREWLRRKVLFAIQDKYIKELEVVGVEKLKEIGDGPAIFVFNHVGHFDSSLIIRIVSEEMRRRQFAVADSELYESKLQSAFLYLFGNAFPLDKINKNNIKSAFEFIADRFDENMVLIIAPEGRISDDGVLQEFKNGTSVLAVETGVPVVTFKIEGYRQIYPRKKKFPYWPEGYGSVKVTVGDVLRFDKKSSYEDVNRAMRGALE